MSKKTIVATTIISILTLIIFIGGFWCWKQEKTIQTLSSEISKKTEEKKEETTIKEPQLNEDWKKIDTSDWKTYRDEKYKFEIKYPEEWEMEDEGYDPYSNEEYLVLSLKSERVALILRGKKTDPSEWIDKMVYPLFPKGRTMKIFSDDFFEKNVQYAINVVYYDNKNMPYITNEYFLGRNDDGIGRYPIY